MRNTGRIPLAIALIAMSLLAFELVTTRIFSVILWNHFAFLAISVALFGFGVAGVAVHVWADRFPPDRAAAQIRGCALALVPLFGAAVAVLCALPIQMDFSPAMFGYLGLVFLATAVPFAVGGLAITLALTHFSKQVNRIYAFDLIGSALGCVLVILLLDRLDGPSTAIAVGLLPALAALWLRPSVAAAIAVPLVLAAIAGNSSQDWVRIRMARSRVQAPVFEKWNAFSRVTVQNSGPWRGWWVADDHPEPLVPVLGILIDADAFTPLIRYRGDLEEVGIVLADLTAAAYQLAPNADSVLVIGAGGGKDVLAALASGAKRVRAIELNPIIARDIVGGHFRDFTGDLYADPRVDLVVGEGRTVVRHDPDRYDILQVSMVDTSAASAAGAYALTENSLYTVDAAREFLAHLTPTGVLTLTWANMPNLKGGNRAVSIYAEALRQLGHAAVDRKIAVLTGSQPKPGRSPLFNVLVRPAGFGAADVSRIRELCDRRGFVPVYLPGDPLHGDPGDPDIAIVRRLISGEDLDTFYGELRLDHRPVDDDRPFFFYQYRFRDTWDALFRWNAGDLYGNGMAIIVKLLVISAGAVLLFMFLPLVVGRRDELRSLRGSGPYLLYFSCLGVGFIVLELALVHLFGYYLGYPLLGLGVVLSSILLFAGLGSALGGRWPEAGLVRRLRFALAGLVAIGLVYHLAVPALTLATLGASVWVRCALAVAVMAPLGLLLGLPFPTGLRLVADRGPGVPWMWAINSGATVFGSALATMVVMHIGFSYTILVGTAVYAVALAVVSLSSMGQRAGAG